MLNTPGDPLDRRLTRVEQHQRTFQRLLVAAREVFTEKGFTAATLDEISLRAGYSRTAVYKHVSSKDELFLALAESLVVDAVAGVTELLTRPATDEARINALAAHLIPDMPAQGSLSQASLEFTGQAHAKPDVTARVLALQRRADADTQALVVRLCESLGVDPPMPMPQLALTVTALVDGLSLRLQYEPDLPARRVFSDALTALLSSASPPAMAADSKATRRRPVQAPQVGRGQ